MIFRTERYGDTTGPREQWKCHGSANYVFITYSDLPHTRRSAVLKASDEIIPPMTVFCSSFSANFKTGKIFFFFLVFFSTVTSSLIAVWNPGFYTVISRGKRVGNIEHERGACVLLLLVDGVNLILRRYLNNCIQKNINI